MIKTDKLINDVRQLISEPDADNSFFSDSMLISALQRALYKLNRMVRIPQAILWLDFPAGTQEIGLPQEVQNVISVQVDNQILSYFTYDTHLKNLPLQGQEIESGIPQQYYIREHYDDTLSDTILVIGFDKKLDKERKVTIHVVIHAPEINSITQDIPLSKDFTLALQNAILAEVYDKDNKGDKAAYYRKLLDDEISELKTKFFNRVPSYVK